VLFAPFLGVALCCISLFLWCLILSVFSLFLGVAFCGVPIELPPGRRRIMAYDMQDGSHIDLVVAPFLARNCAMLCNALFL
jgi:hypothetical protein